MFRVGTVAAVVVAVTIGTAVLNRRNETMAAQIVELKVGLDGSVADFSKRNGLDRNADYHGRRDGGIFAFQARASMPRDPAGYVLTYDGGGCNNTLPAGRYVQLGYDGPFINNAVSVLPTEPLPFDDAAGMAESIYRSMIEGGWETRDYEPGMTPERIAEGAYPSGAKGTKNEYIYARMDGCAPPEVAAYVIVKYYNSLPPGPSVPPVPGRALPDDHPDRYLITVSFRTSPSPAFALREARRLAVTGSEREDIGIDIWLDDPDWRPEGWDGR